MLIPRWWWAVLLIACGLIAFVAKAAPANLSVIVYKLAVLSLAVLISTLLDRAFFKPSRKAEPYANVARSLVFLGVVLGLSLGL